MPFWSNTRLRTPIERMTKRFAFSRFRWPNHPAPRLRAYGFAGAVLMWACLAAVAQETGQIEEAQTETPEAAETTADSGDIDSQPKRLVSVYEAGPPQIDPETALTADIAYGSYQRGLYLSALAIATPLAEGGDASAQTLVGVLHETGQGIRQDYTKAADWYALAAAQGNAEAALRLGQFYLAGQGVEQDKAKAADFFEIAAEAGEPAAQYNLAILYQSGEGRPYDETKARELLEAAAQGNDPEAQYTLGLTYLEGLDGNLDPGQGAFWLGRAARRGHTSAQVYYGILRFQGRGVDPNEAEAAAWFERAASNGNPVAMNRLARVYANGRGRELDPITAAAWHYVARASGVSDMMLDSFVAGLSEEQVQAARKQAERYTTTIMAPTQDPNRPTP